MYVDLLPLVTPSHLLLIPQPMIPKYKTEQEGMKAPLIRDFTYDKATQLIYGMFLVFSERRVRQRDRLYAPDRRQHLGRARWRNEDSVGKDNADKSMRYEANGVE